MGDLLRNCGDFQVVLAEGAVVAIWVQLGFVYPRSDHSYVHQQQNLLQRGLFDIEGRAAFECYHFLIRNFVLDSISRLA